MSAHGWCWRCAEQDRVTPGVDTGTHTGPLCDDCRAVLDEGSAHAVDRPLLDAMPRKRSRDRMRWLPVDLPAPIKSWRDVA